MPRLNPDYDPDWKSRWERTHSLVEATHDKRHLAAMHHAFWCQFKTMAEIRDFHLNDVKQRAEAAGLELTDAVPYIDDDCTWDDISTAYNAIDDAINEYLCRGARFPHKHPADLEGFSDDDNSAQRFTEYYKYAGYHNFPSACHLTVEYQENRAYVCFTLLPDAGTSPINMIEDLATLIYRDELADRYEPGEVSWFTYHRFSGSFGHEGFMQARMTWDKRRKQFGRVEWVHFNSVPTSIAKTTELDGDDKPEALVRERQYATERMQEANSNEG